MSQTADTDQRAARPCPAQPPADVRRATARQEPLLGQSHPIQAIGLLRGRWLALARRAPWQSLLERQALWRTAFRWQDCGLPLAVVHRSAALAWTVQDWSGLDRASQRHQLRRWLALDRQQPLELTRPPLLRVSVLRLGSQRAWLVLSLARVLWPELGTFPPPLAVAFSLPQPGRGQGPARYWWLGSERPPGADRTNPGPAAFGCLRSLLEEVRRPFLEPRSRRSPQPSAGLPEQGLAALVSEQAARRPNALALSQGDQRLSYAELDQAANRLARQLLAAGVEPLSRVALGMDRSIELVVLMLAVLKAGAVYVPLDRASPAARLGRILADVRPSLVLAQQSWLPRLPAQAVSWESLSAAARDQPSGPAGRDWGADQLAYIMYTSGSTGQPKGVCISQRGVARLACGADYVVLGPATVVAHAASPAFDAATFEIWAPLLSGGRVSILPVGSGLSPPELYEFLRREAVTTLFLTTAWFHQLVATQPQGLAGLRELLVGGERLDPKAVRGFWQGKRPRRLLNMYGPTEVTTFATWHEIKQPPAPDQNIPIGQPIAHTRAELREGELWLAGPGLAQGYLNQPGLTAHRFPTDPLSGERYYRTGDLAQYRADGALLFLGRQDQQVKLRGFRIELGEIEAALNQQASIQASAVTLHQERLVAWLVRRPGWLIRIPELRQSLAERLPLYMLPTDYRVVSSLPLTTSGKLDRTALSALGAAGPALEPTPPPVRAVTTQPERGTGGVTTERLAAIWRQTLGVSRVGVEDNFFTLGGHSLLAVRLLTQIEKVFERKLSLRTFFEQPTIRALARQLAPAGAALPLASSLVALQAQGRQPPLVLVHGIGGGMLWGYSNLARHLAADQPVYVITSHWQNGDTQTLSIEQLAEQYVAQVRALQGHGPYYLGGYCFGGNVAVEMARRVLQAGQQVALLALINSEPPTPTPVSSRWNLRRTVLFGWNLAYWLGCYLRWEPGYRREIRRWRWQTVQRRLEGRRSQGIEQLADLTPYPPEVRRLWELHYQALINHRPQPYPGRILLLRSRAYPPSSRFDPQYGWGQLAGAGVVVRVVPGAHDSIIREPAVRVLAQHLQTALQEAQAQ